MKLDDIDFDDLVAICEGNEDTAELLERFIRENPADGFDDEDQRCRRIGQIFAEYMNGFWDEDSTNEDGEPIDQDDHWEQNYAWGMELLESIQEWEE